MLRLNIKSQELLSKGVAIKVQDLGERVAFTQSWQSYPFPLLGSPLLRRERVREVSKGVS
jgi:hypothetical protein